MANADPWLGLLVLILFVWVGYQIATTPYGGRDDEDWF